MSLPDWTCFSDDYRGSRGIRTFESSARSSSRPFRPMGRRTCGCTRAAMRPRRVDFQPRQVLCQALYLMRERFVLHLSINHSTVQDDDVTLLKHLDQCIYKVWPSIARNNITSSEWRNRNERLDTSIDSANPEGMSAAERVTPNTDFGCVNVNS